MFNKIIQFVLEQEGGYVNNPKDPGGATNMGIIQRTLDRYNTLYGLPKEDVKTLRKDKAIDIYHEFYWQPVWEELGFPLAACMLDTSINMGLSRAQEFLKGCNGFYVAFLQLRLAKYKELIQRNPNLKVFENGWNNRVALLRRYIDSEKDSFGTSAV